MNRDKWPHPIESLIDKVEELFWRSEFLTEGEPRELAKVVAPLIEADLREQIAGEIEAHREADESRGNWGAGVRFAASIVRGASADTDPAPDNTKDGHV